jgi:predicted small lipoprotein YifL
MSSASAIATLAALAALAGCGSEGASQSPSAGSATATASPKAKPPRRSAQAAYQVKALAVARKFSRCARANGQPEFPDPVMRNDEPEWPGTDKTDLKAVAEACASILDSWPENPKLTAPPTPEIRAKMRGLAKCMREHGVSDFPDPNADGTFSLEGTRLDTDIQPTGQVAQAWGDCRSYLDGWIVRQR